MANSLNEIIDALSAHMPSAMRWSGAIARQLRQHNIDLTGKKTSGSALTDALTLADLTVQELLVAALRDADPILRQCRIEAEESSGDLGHFASESPWVISLDPIDGTKQYRDKTGNGYAVMLHLRDESTVHYSLVFVPETGRHGTWVECRSGRLVSGLDDPQRPARNVLDSLPNLMSSAARTISDKYYLIGFQHRDRAAAAAVTRAGLTGVAPDDMPGSIYDLMATGVFEGSLIHSPNVYDFPVALQIARTLGGDSLWVDTGEPVHFRETWLDETADMARLPRIVATSVNREHLDTLCNLARSWNPVRYRAGEEL